MAKNHAVITAPDGVDEVMIPTDEARDILKGAQGVQIQAQIVVAHQFPRDEARTTDALMASCRRVALASKAVYAFPKGGKIITGPSIRLAEAMAQRRGNIAMGTVNLFADDRAGFTQMMAYAWDMETNSFKSNVFRVRHDRKAHGRVHRITDPMELYGMEANLASRRLRECILSVIPVDVREEAVEVCAATMVDEITAHVEDYVLRLADDFAEACGVTVTMLENRLGHRIEESKPKEVLELQMFLRAVQDGFIKGADLFPELAGPKPPEKPEAAPGPTEAQRLSSRYKTRGQPIQAAEPLDVTPKPEKKDEDDAQPE